jgi:ABC-2 type transport system ATP-binding protein
VCTRRQETDLPGTLEVIWAEHTDGQSTFFVRSETELPVGDWSAEHLDLEDLVLTYMERANAAARRSGTRSSTTRDAR